MRQDPFMEFTVRPLPPDDLMAGVAEQAKIGSNSLTLKSSSYSHVVDGS